MTEGIIRGKDGGCTIANSSRCESAHRIAVRHSLADTATDSASDELQLMWNCGTVEHHTGE